jgi:gliding motility-associated-like protein
MRWLLFILLPFSLFSQETYDNCQNVPIQNYQVEYDANKEYFWYISEGVTNLDNIFDNHYITIKWPDTAGVYSLQVWTTKFGCKGDTSYHEVIVTECTQTQLFFPNSFTPNGDNVNEVYEIKGRSVDNIEYMSVYNRWGQKIIESNSNILWDGSNCQIGVYTINVFVDNNRYVRNVTLIK